MPERRTLYLIGIDSAPLRLTRDFARKYGLRGLEKVMRDGILTSLESTLPPITAAAWPTIYTGVPPSKHGMMNFFYIDRDYNKRLALYDAKRHRPFWELLADKGMKCLVITPAMVTELSDSKNVDMITGFPLKPKFSSARMEDAAKKHGFMGEPEIEQDLKDSRISFSEATSSYVDSIRKRAEASKQLIKENGYDFVFVCFTETDRIQHYAMGLKNMEEFVAPLYKEIDGFIQWIMANAGKAKERFAVLIVSDHGAQPIKKKILLNTWLINNGYAVLGPGSAGDGLKVNTSRPKGLVSAEGLRDEKYHEQVRIHSKGPVTRFICASVVETSDEDITAKRPFEMKRTKAFASLSNNPVSSIWINDSRFSEPGASDGSKKKLIAEISKKLMELSDHGKKAIARASPGSEYYGSTGLFIIPDIIVEAGEGYTIDVFNHSDEGVFSDPESARSGDHTREGIFGYYSNFMKQNPRNLSVLDIYNMLLNYFS